MRKRFETIVVVLAVALILVGAHLYVTFYTPASSVKEPRTVQIPKGMSFRLIAGRLEEAGVVRDSDSFTFAGRLLGAYKLVKAGEYEFNTGMTPMEVLDLLIKGKVKRYLVTIPEGYNIREIASALKAAGLIEEEVFMARAYDPALAASLGVDGPTFEGYLFPDTYEFTKDMSADEMIEKMTGKFRSVYSEIAGEAERSGMTMRKAVTLASIIEKETGEPGERELISSVFHNRLRKRVRLQSDPTVIYAMPGFDGNLTRKHLGTRTPYNTYVIYGLPPGPIASPGRDALRAAINPAATEFLYFVSRNDGTHHFSKSLKEHNEAVRQFQKGYKVARQVGKKG